MRWRVRFTLWTRLSKENWPFWVGEVLQREVKIWPGVKGWRKISCSAPERCSSYVFLIFLIECITYSEILHPVPHAQMWLGHFAQLHLDQDHLELRHHPHLRFLWQPVYQSSSGRPHHNLQLHVLLDYIQLDYVLLDFNHLDYVNLDYIHLGHCLNFPTSNCLQVVWISRTKPHTAPQTPPHSAGPLLIMSRMSKKFDKQLLS